MRIEKRSPVEGSRAQDILDAIGNTPLVQVDGVWAKLEFLNPSGSVKARLAKYVIVNMYQNAAKLFRHPLPEGYSVG